MKSINRVLKALMNKQLTLPSELLDLPTITITGDKQISIEQHYELVLFTDNEIKLRCKSGVIQINGRLLMIKTMYNREIIVEGVIEKIEFLN